MVLKAVTLPAMPDMKEASKPVSARPSRPVRTILLDQGENHAVVVIVHGILEAGFI